MSTHHADEAPSNRRRRAQRRRSPRDRRVVGALAAGGALAVAVTLGVTLSGSGSPGTDTVAGTSATDDASGAPSTSAASATAPDSATASATASPSDSAAASSAAASVQVTATGGDDGSRVYVSDVPGGGLLVSYWEGTDDDAAAVGTQGPSQDVSPSTSASPRAAAGATAGITPAVVLSVAGQVEVARDAMSGAAASTGTTSTGTGTTGPSAAGPGTAQTGSGTTGTTVTLHLTTRAQTLYLIPRSTSSAGASAGSSSGVGSTAGSPSAAASGDADAEPEPAASSTATASTTSTASATSVTATASSRTVKIMPLGDSIIQGQQFGGARTDLWQQFTAAGYHIDFVGSQSDGPASLPDKDNEGHSGESIADMLPDTAAWVRAAKPDVVMVSAGGNDMMHDQGAGIAQRYPQYLDTICGAAPGARIVVATNHQLDTRVHGTAAGGGDGFNALMSGTLNPVIRARAGTTAAGGCPVSVVDMDGVIDDTLLADDLHPNAAGYAAMGRAWFPALRSAVDAVRAKRS